jgi:hypothetical protein
MKTTIYGLVGSRFQIWFTWKHLVNIFRIEFYLHLNAYRCECFSVNIEFYRNMSKGSDPHSRSQSDAQKVMTSRKGVFFYFIKSAYKGTVAMQMRLSYLHNVVFWQPSVCRHVNVTEYILPTSITYRACNYSWNTTLTTSIQRHCLVLLWTFSCLSLTPNFTCFVQMKNW